LSIPIAVTATGEFNVTVGLSFGMVDTFAHVAEIRPAA
jgi:hypothetical protein